MKMTDPIGRDLIKLINSTNYIRTTMFCSGHFEDEDPYPWGQAFYICFCILDYKKAMPKLIEIDAFLYLKGIKNKLGLPVATWNYVDTDNNDTYVIGSIRIEYETKEERQQIIDILTEVFLA